MRNTSTGFEATTCRGRSRGFIPSLEWNPQDRWVVLNNEGSPNGSKKSVTFHQVPAWRSTCAWRVSKSEMQLSLPQCAASINGVLPKPRDEGFRSSGDRQKLKHNSRPRPLCTAHLTQGCRNTLHMSDANASVATYLSYTQWAASWEDSAVATKLTVEPASVCACPLVGVTGI